MAVGDAQVFPGFQTPALPQLSFRSHRLLFSYASTEVRGKNTPERKFASTGSPTYNSHGSDTPTTEPPGSATDLYCRHVKTRACLGKGYFDTAMSLS